MDSRLAIVKGMLAPFVPGSIRPLSCVAEPCDGARSRIGKGIRTAVRLLVLFAALATTHFHIEAIPLLGGALACFIVLWWAVVRAEVLCNRRMLFSAGLAGALFVGGWAHLWRTTLAMRSEIARSSTWRRGTDDRWDQLYPSSGSNEFSRAALAALDGDASSRERLDHVVRERLRGWAYACVCLIFVLEVERLRSFDEEFAKEGRPRLGEKWIREFAATRTFFDRDEVRNPYPRCGNSYFGYLRPLGFDGLRYYRHLSDSERGYVREAERTREEALRRSAARIEGAVRGR